MSNGAYCSDVRLGRILRNTFVDQLRGISILMVLFGHLLRNLVWWVLNLPEWATAKIITSAYYGVSIFFVISWYLITRNIRTANRRPTGHILPNILRAAHRPNCSSTITPDYRKRMPHGCSRNRDKPAKSAQRPSMDLSAGFSAWQQLMPHTDSTYVPLWSLSVEETFYIFLPRVCVMVVTKSKTDHRIDLRGPDRLLLPIGACLYLYFFQHIRPVGDGRPCRHSCSETAGYRRPALATFAAVERTGRVGVLYLTTSVDNLKWVSAVALSAAIYLVGSPLVLKPSSAPLRLVEFFGFLSYEIYTCSTWWSHGDGNFKHLGSTARLIAGFFS
jgi:peptidoglycan/LPS O-acetylase OafA/YrhL